MPKVEPIIVLLAILMAVFTVALFAAEKMFPNDGQIFQVVSGILTATSGAFFMRIKQASDRPAVSDPAAVITKEVAKDGEK